MNWQRAASIPAVVIDCDPEDRTLIEYHENVYRKDFTISEMVEIGKTMERAVGERRGRPGDDEGVTNHASETTEDQSDSQVKNSRKCDELNQGDRTDEAAASIAGFGSKDTYRRAKAVTESNNPELVKLVDDGRFTTWPTEYN